MTTQLQLINIIIIIIIIKPHSVASPNAVTRNCRTILKMAHTTTLRITGRQNQHTVVFHKMVLLPFSNFSTNSHIDWEPSKTLCFRTFRCNITQQNQKNNSKPSIAVLLCFTLFGMLIYSLWLFHF